MEKEVYQKIGKKLQELRKQRGLTQEQVARHLGITQNQLSYYETGAREIDIGTLQRLARLYGCDYNYLLEDNETLNEQIIINFRADEISDEDLDIIAFVNEFVMNLDIMYKMSEEIKNE
ncbi:Transcriptional regulator, contains XRE-family HTH domain [Thermoanaerobacter thermohydrosulfuricus]|uniref:Transcriptional regulator, contains XRE-family HTH domain n=1 Tax=Thermoanaerobacter thermohydrosulfuricus TaxID=1516 RepID=A0A1G7WJV2_THETY|nr:helix-turn-helix transcriptional regulator [Thermoanaerobacter thermohydrosulfuricus]SDG72213.1 Transcriptional regulator, contains XRE-family HTH domain [Thermoanaerobacter thermohydrosulfuricus]